jgi:hypothetical protein
MAASSSHTHLGKSLLKRDQVLVQCVFHDDSRPGFSVNLQAQKRKLAAIPVHDKIK